MSSHDSGGVEAAMPRSSRWAVAVPLIVIIGTGMMIAWSAWPHVRPARSVEVAQVVFHRSAEPSPAQPAVTVQAPGWLEAEPYTVACTALADGVIESIEVLEGDLVEKGQIVARLIAEDAELRLARAEGRLAGARATVQLAEAELVAAEAENDELVDRRRAATTSAEAVIAAQAELEQLPSLIAAAEANLARLIEELEWAKRSVEGLAATELEVTIAEQRVAAQQATVESIQGRRPILEANIRRLQAEHAAAARHIELRIEEQRQLDVAAATLAKAQADLVEAAAMRDEAALELERMVIAAPISGYVQRRIKRPGDKVMLGMDDPHSAHILHIYDPSDLQVRVDVPLADAAHVAVGQPCEVVVEILPDVVFRGEVLRITHEADLQKNTLQVKVKVLDPSPLLKPEMLTRVKFNPSGSAGAAPAGVLVPLDAVTNLDADPRLWVVRDRRGRRGAVASTPISIQQSNDGWAEVTGPINPGDLVVIGAEGLAEGQAVRMRGRES